MPNKTNDAHAAAVARAVMADPHAYTHASTLQRLYLCHVNEQRLEKQLSRERAEVDRLSEQVNQLTAALRNRPRVKPPRQRGRVLVCACCGQEVEAVSHTSAPKYKFCRWCGTKIRRG